MLDYFREGAQGPTLKIIIGAIIVSFVLVGAGQVVSIGGQTAPIEVNGVDIEEMDIQRQTMQVASQLQQQRWSQAQIEAQARDMAKERLINSVLLQQFGEENGMGASEAAVTKAILLDPTFQIDGKFNEEQYRRVISQLGYSPKEFKEFQKRQIQILQLQTSLISSDFALPSEVENVVALQEQTRTFKYKTFAVADANVEISNDEIMAYYNANSARYLSDELVSVDYVVYSAANVAPSIDVSDLQIRAAYDAWVAEQKNSELREVAHILVTDNVAENIAAIEKKLAEGQSFADLAAEYSQDFATAEEGGYFGALVDGFDEQFNAAARTLMQVGDVSPAVETSYGTHLIRLENFEQKEIAPLAERKAAIVADIQLAEARKVLAERKIEMDDLLYTSSESLNDVAKLLDLTVQTSEFFSRGEGNGIAVNQLVRDAAFSEDVKMSAANSSVIVLSDDEFVGLRLNKVKAPELQPLDAVREDIVATLTDSAVKSLVNEQAKALLDQAKSTAVETNDWLLVEDSTRFDPKADFNVLQQVFKMPLPVEGKQALSRVTGFNGDVHVVELVSVAAGNIDAIEESVLTQTKDIVAQIESTSGFIGFSLGVRSAADIKQNGL